MEARSQIYDPGTEDKIRPHERRGDSPLVNVPKRFGSGKGGRGYLRLTKHEARLFPALRLAADSPAWAWTRGPWVVVMPIQDN